MADFFVTDRQIERGLGGISLTISAMKDLPSCADDLRTLPGREAVDLGATARAQFRAPRRLRGHWPEPTLISLPAWAGRVNLRDEALHFLSLSAVLAFLPLSRKVFMAVSCGWRDSNPTVSRQNHPGASTISPHPLLEPKRFLRLPLFVSDDQTAPRNASLYHQFSGSKENTFRKLPGFALYPFRASALRDHN